MFALGPDPPAHHPSLGRTEIVNGFGIIGVTFRTEPARTVVFAILAMGNPIGSTSGPILGGAVAQRSKGGWRLLSYIHVGLTLVSIIIGILVIPRGERKKDENRRIDWLGGGLITSCVCLFTFSVTRSGIASRGWREPSVHLPVHVELTWDVDVPALLATSIILFALALLRE